MAYFTDEMNKGKLLFLYFLKSMNTVLSRMQMSVAMTELGVSYFEVQPMFEELENKGFIATVPCTFGEGYMNTEKADELLSATQQQLPMSARAECDEYIKSSYERIIQLERFSAYSVQRSEGYEAILTSYDRQRSILSLAISVPDSATARKICDNWQSRSALIYQVLTELLLTDDDTK